MKLYLQILKLLYNKIILRKANGEVIKDFVESMGIVYIKLAQMLATQNYKNLFTENDRRILSDICDCCNQISYGDIEETLREEYGEDFEEKFLYIQKRAVGSASVSQVHRAILKTGEEVAIKIKRKDITSNVEKEIKRIKKIVHRYGKIFNFSNFIGGDHALDLYFKWIQEETNFNHEKENIKLYQKFADSVNGKVKGTKDIKLPKLYEEYCTENIIVMEFIHPKTIKKMELNSENKKRIILALNSYIKSSFWAFYNGEKIVFHGDPHSGNICIDDENNIYFLDMGMLCALSVEEAELCRNLFLAAFAGNYMKLFYLLKEFGNLNEKEQKDLKNYCVKYCEDVRNKDITHYFVDLINICLTCEIDPPDFLFSMARAFVCLNGIFKFSENKCTGKDLLREQTIEYLLKRSVTDTEGLMINNLQVAPDLFGNTLRYGLVDTLSKITISDDFIKGKNEYLENFKEMIDLFYLFCSNNKVIQEVEKEKHL